MINGTEIQVFAQQWTFGDVVFVLHSWFCDVKFQNGPFGYLIRRLPRGDCGTSVAGSGSGLPAGGTSGAVPAILWLLRVGASLP